MRERLRETGLVRRERALSLTAPFRIRAREVSCVRGERAESSKALL